MVVVVEVKIELASEEEEDEAELLNPGHDLLLDSILSSPFSLFTIMRL